MVADPVESSIAIFSTPDHELVAQFSGIEMNTHAGFLPMQDGRMLLVDAAANQLVAFDLWSIDGPVIVATVPVPASVSHIAVDPTGTYAAVGSSEEGSTITLVDLTTYTAQSFDIEAGEVGLMLGGDPLTLFHRNDVASQIEAFPVSDLEEGATSPVSTVATGAFGHGEGIVHSLGRIYAATDDGVDVVDFSGSELTYHATLPWESGELTGGRAYFVRVGANESVIVSYIANRGTEETLWGDWTNDVYLINTATDEVVRTPLAPGLVYRLGLAEDVALFFNQHPDGDFAHIVDVDPNSPDFGSVIQSVPLEPLSNAVGPDDDPWAGESRVVTISPDGSTGYVTAGGDGYIAVIDIASGMVTGRIDTPTALGYGGYILAVDPGVSVWDTIGR
ncbi:MAG: hypothetical protein KF883_03295 [Thermomicrobiales bacterium]|nr:hypothetical protein [Thermomicrobiales bacterium]